MPRRSTIFLDCPDLSYLALVVFLAHLLGSPPLGGQEISNHISHKIIENTEPVHSGIRSYTVSSPYQKGSNTLEILLPDDFSPQKRYPVLYLLPVNTGPDGQWGSGIVEAQRLHLQNQHQMIFVAPAYEILPWYGDNPTDPGARQSSYLTDVIVPFVDREFPTLAEPAGRLLVGFSKSGLGAWSLFLMRPDLFGKLATFDSFDGPPTQAQWNTWGFIANYGTRENYDSYDPFILLEKHKEKLQKLPRRIALLAGGPGSRIGVDKYRSKLQDAKIPHVYLHDPGMAHTWTSGWLPLAVAAIAYPESSPRPEK